MYRVSAPTRLLPQQTRLIHAKEGVRLRVVAGHLWLTQPNVAQDLFLGPGDSVDLKQDWVVVGADGAVRVGELMEASYSAYELQPLVALAPSARRFSLMQALRAWVRGRPTGGLQNIPPGASAP
ncbi:MAG: DUF2917 domain-containing protein [Burkholderiaceae bacterium]